MKIVVTGGAGMIGSNLVAALLKQEHEVHVIDNFWRGSISNLEVACGDTISDVKIHVADLSLFGDWIKILEGADCVYHLADIVAGIGYVFSNEGFIFRKNLHINGNVAAACEMMNVGRYIYVGTACSFPLELQTGVDAKPMKESQQYPAHPESAYGWSKLMGELDAKYMSQASGIPSVVLVFHNVYGTPTEFQSNRAQAIPAMCYRALTEGTKSGVLNVWGDGTQGRAFVHVDEVVSALLQSLTKGENVGPIQIGPDFCTSISEISKKIVDIVDPEIRIHFDKSKPIGDKGRCADYSKAKAVLGWQPTISIDDGLRQLIRWIQKSAQLR